MGSSCRLWFGIVGTLKNLNSSLRKSFVWLIKMDVLNEIVLQGYSRNINIEYLLMKKQKHMNALCTNVEGTGR
jgi:hypothetical protein